MRRNKVDVASIVPAIMAGATYREAIARFGISEVTYYKYRSLAGMAQPVSTDVGLVGATLLDTFITPALFWLFGQQPAQRLLAEGGEDNF